MIAEPTDPFLAALRQFNLLDPARVAELTAWAAQHRPDARDWARELLRRGWMTPYQIKQVYHGRGAELVLGPYVLLDLLGEGGMGRVFKAFHPRLGREIALKVIRKEKVAKPAVVERFSVEIRAAAKLSHPNVVLALDADEADGTHYFAMEYVEGTDLTRLVRERGPLPVPLACDYIRQAALGLQHAHERRLVHRDVKPSNLLVTPRGQVKVLDLGLALLKRDAGSDRGRRMTQDGYILGTPDFLAPEQAQNPLGVDVRADVYALGATLFYLLAGRVPYDGATPAEKLVQHVTAPPPSLLQCRPDAPPQLDVLIQWMMAKRPEDRPQTAAQAAAALVPFCDPALGTAPQPVYAAPPVAAPPVAAPAAETLAFDAATPTPREPRTAYHRSTSSGAGLKLAIFASIGLCALLAAGGVGYVLWNSFGSEPPLPAEFANVAGMKMIQLPGGSFVMGSPAGEPGRDANEGPAGEVTIAGPFFVSATEVSEGQFVQIMGTSRAKWPRKMRKPAAVPVDSVTWDEANEFCRKLTQRDGHRRSGWAYRLPTEAEWEYACRAGTTTPFWSGDKLVLGKQAIFNLDESGDLGEPDLSKPPVEKNLPYPVGSTEANPFGLFDTSGNVWEWCADYYAPNYDGRAAQNPKGPDAGDWRVLRGGSWREKAGRARSAARRGMSPTHREEDVGFRVVFAPAK